MSVLGRQGESKFGDNEREENLQLNHSKVFPQAQARTQSKGDIGLGKFAGIGDTVGESVWSEIVDILSPNIGIPVQCWNESPQAYALGDDNVSNLGLFKGLS